MSNEIVQYGLNEQIAYANAVAKAGIIPQAYRGKPADIIVAMGFGQSMGLSPAESLYRINVIQGKPTASAELIAAQVRKAGHKLRISKDESKLSVTATIVRADDPEYPISVTRDKAWAQQMGLTGKDNYKKQPLTMLTWRAITACAREACPEALFGVAYTPDEMHDLDDTRQTPQNAAEQPMKAEVVSVEPVAAEAPKKAATADLSAISARKEAFMTRLGYTAADVNRVLCEYVDVRSLRDATPEQVELCAQYMDEIINTPVIL